MRNVVHHVVRPLDVWSASRRRTPEAHPLGGVLPLHPFDRVTVGGGPRTAAADQSGKRPPPRFLQARRGISFFIEDLHTLISG